jgi:hypothetical protein
MLVRDVVLVDAIIDLVDNSVDAATRVSGSDSLRSFKIELTVSPTSFNIKDNCGGMTVGDARNRAFRFGRTPQAVDDAAHDGVQEIGQFGVGMKRTIFKLGRYFTVSARTDTSYFEIEQDVDQWLLTDDADWHFDFKTTEEQTQQTPPFGTTVSVTRLHAPVSAQFATDLFLNTLESRIQAAHAIALTRGLEISINGRIVPSAISLLLASEVLTPAKVSRTIPIEGQGEVKVELIAGVAKPQEDKPLEDSRERGLRDGGWYVFCNDRLVLRSDQSALTGWGTSAVPRYHPTYAYFRGYAFFSSDNGSHLPWTTTKSGIDSDSPVYRYALLDIIDTMRPVLDFLRSVEEERSRKAHDDIEDTPLYDAMKTATSVPIEHVQYGPFRAPEAPREPRPPRTTVRVQYDAAIVDVERVKRKLKVSSAGEAGSKTLKYYIEMECD